MNQDIVQFFESLRHPVITPIVIAITNLGNELFYIAAIAAFYWVWDKDIALKLATGITTSSYLNNVLKIVIGSPRPYANNSPEDHWLGVDVEEYKLSNGMPSGHAQGAGTFWTLLGYYVNNRKFWWFAGIMILLIGLSRLYLAVHFLEDVIVGWILGITIAIIIQYAWVKGEKFFEEKTRVTQFAYSLSPIALFLLALLMFGAEEKTDFASVSMGALIGIWIGHLLQEQYIGFSSRAENKLTLGVRIFVGYIILVPLTFLLSILQHALFDSSPMLLQLILTLFRYMFIGFTATFIIPILFTKIEID